MKGTCGLTDVFDFSRKTSWGERVWLRGHEALIAGGALYLAWDWAAYMRKIARVVAPVGVARWVDLSPLLRAPFPEVNAALIGACLALGFTGRLRAGYALSVLLLHLQYAARFSLGKTSHGSNIVGIALVGFALGAFLFRHALSARRFALGFGVVMIALSYVSAALCKLIATGPGWIAGDHLALWVYERGVDGLSKHGAFALNPLQVRLLEQPALATLTLSFGLAAEALAFLAVFRRYRPWVFGSLIAMHLGIWASMDILFEWNLCVLASLTFPWAAWLDRAHARLAPVECAHTLDAQEPRAWIGSQSPRQRHANDTARR